jgi:hypothetical protein
MPKQTRLGRSGTHDMQCHRNLVRHALCREVGDVEYKRHHGQEHTGREAIVQVSVLQSRPGAVGGDSYRLARLHLQSAQPSARRKLEDTQRRIDSPWATYAENGGPCNVTFHRVYRPPCAPSLLQHRRDGGWAGGEPPFCSLPGIAARSLRPGLAAAGAETLSAETPASGSE